MHIYVRVAQATARLRSSLSGAKPMLAKKPPVPIVDLMILSSIVIVLLVYLLIVITDDD